MLGACVPLVLAPVPLAGFSFMEKYQTPAIATMHAPKIILRISGVISVSSLLAEDRDQSLRGRVHGIVVVLRFCKPLLEVAI